MYNNNNHNYHRLFQNQKKCKIFLNIVLEVNVIIIVAIQKKNIMLKECVITVIINMEELKNHGFVDMKNYMLVNIFYL